MRGTSALGRFALHGILCFFNKIAIRSTGYTVGVPKLHRLDSVDTGIVALVPWCIVCLVWMACVFVRAGMRGGLGDYHCAYT
jgi:hypothetical protein